MTESVLARIDPGRIKFEPFPHLHISEALDPAYYAALAEAFPSMEQVAGEKPMGNNTAHLLSAKDVVEDPAIPAIWREFFSYHCSTVFFRELLRFWASALEREYPGLEARFGKPLEMLSTGMRYKSWEKTPENLKADMMLDCQFGINSPVTAPCSVRGPHVDKPHKLFAGLLYFRRPDDASTGGDLGLYRLRTERYYHDGRLDVRPNFVEQVAEVPYRPNTLIMWLNTPRSLHGVSPRSVCAVPRRYVNLLAECYTLATDGFFQVKQNFAVHALRAVRRLAGMRDA